MMNTNNINSVNVLEEVAAASAYTYEVKHFITKNNKIQLNVFKVNADGSKEEVNFQNLTLHNTDLGQNRTLYENIRVGGKNNNTKFVPYFSVIGTCWWIGLNPQRDFSNFVISEIPDLHRICSAVALYSLKHQDEFRNIIKNCNESKNDALNKSDVLVVNLKDLQAKGYNAIKIVFGEEE